MERHFCHTPIRMGIESVTAFLSQEPKTGFLQDLDDFTGFENR